MHVEQRTSSFFLIRTVLSIIISCLLCFREKSERVTKDIEFYNIV